MTGTVRGMSAPTRRGDFPARDRFYRGGCAHGMFYAILAEAAADSEKVSALCPTCGPVVLVTLEG